MKKSHALFAFIGLVVLLTAGAAQGLSGTNTVDSGDIIDAQVKFADIAPNAVTQSRIADNGVASSELSATAVRASDLGTITQRSAVSASVAPGATGSALATCLAGEKVITGGNDGSLSSVVIASRREGNGWRVFFRNNGGANTTGTTHAYCLAS